MAEIWAYIASEASETAATQFLSAIEQAFQPLLHTPMIGVRREHLGRVNTTECFNDQSEVDEGNKHHIKFLEAGEDTPESLQSSEQSLNLVTPPIHSFVVFPRLNPIGFGRYYRDETKLQHQLPRFVPFVGSIHQQMNWPAGLAQAAE
ncbi:MAG: hypothetical protein NTAFB09_11840 [Nitrosospira sp.]